MQNGHTLFSVIRINYSNQIGIKSLKTCGIQHQTVGLLGLSLRVYLMVAADLVKRRNHHEQSISALLSWKSKK
jgi:hypothetical protein